MQRKEGFATSTTPSARIRAVEYDGHMKVMQPIGHRHVMCKTSEMNCSWLAAGWLPAARCTPRCLSLMPSCISARKYPHLAELRQAGAAGTVPPCGRLSWST